MLAIVKSVGLLGLDGHLINVEVDVSPGLPGLEIVGLPDAAVRESKDRVKTAIKNSGFEFPMQRITVNLAPADIRKTGPLYDLPIAIGILTATGQIPISVTQAIAYCGELSLDGSIKPITGILPMAFILRSLGLNQFVVPLANGQEAALLTDLQIMAPANLIELVEYLRGDRLLQPVAIDPTHLLMQKSPGFVDFCDIKGQTFAKRALEIAAAGGHNLMMMGPPGSGKTLLARSFPSILPQLTLEESFAITKIHSLAGLLNPDQPLVTTRPFRSPHHSASTASLVGGGRIPKPGEVALAHFGVLFLDEFPEFSRDAIEALRQPLEDGQVTISRVQTAISYPARIQLISALNPCPCGYFGDSHHHCTCTPTMVQRYRSRISGPMLDRIDIQIEVPRIPYDELDSKILPEASQNIQQRITKARNLQQLRLAKHHINCNAHMDPRETRLYCQLNPVANAFLKNAFNRLQLSARVTDRIKKLARTIADLANQELIEVDHIAEAIQLRSLDRTI